MGANTRIPWCDHTFNPWIGCTKVSLGCLNCYAEREQAIRYGRVKWGKGHPRHRTSATYWKQPQAWNHAEDGKMVSHAEFVENRRPRVFCASLADWLDPEVPVAWRADLLRLIRRTPNLDWLLLTKRPQLWKALLDDVCSYLPPPDPDVYPDSPRTLQDWIIDWYNDQPPANVWIGVTAEDQEQADRRVSTALDIPARVHFVSYEPALGPVDFSKNFWLTGQARRRDKTLTPPRTKARVDWVIVGGESGPEAREFCLDHALDVVGQCRDTQTAVFVKQLGARPVTTNANLYDFPDHVGLIEFGTAAAGARVVLRDRNGRNVDEWPEQLQLQEFPKP